MPSLLQLLHLLYYFFNFISTDILTNTIFGFRKVQCVIYEKLSNKGSLIDL